MRIVLDTNVLIAALIARGVCIELLEHCVLSHTVLASDFILNELHANLIGKFKYTAQEADEAAALFASQMEMVVPMQLSAPVCRDPDDDHVIGTALAGQADCIVTGDSDLLVLKRYEEISIVAPSAFTRFEEMNRGETRNHE